MSTFQERLAAASDRHAQLLAASQAVAHAPSEAKATREYLQDITAALQKINQEVAAAQSAVKREHEDHVKYSESTMRKFMFKATGQRSKFEEKAAKEAQEYFDAIQRANDLAAQQKMLEKQKAETTDALERLLKQATEFDHIRTQLDVIYHDVFDGPTPEVPGEDELEEAVNNARARFDSLNGRLATQARVIELLKKAELMMRATRRDLQDAHGYSNLDVWGIGGSMADFAERSLLNQAQVKAGQLGMLVFQAQQLDPLVQPLPLLQISQGNMMGDVLFDNIFSDLDFHDKIKRAELQAERAHAVLSQQIDTIEMHYKDTKRNLKQAEADRDAATQELTRIREDTFKMVDAPPAYEA